MGTAVPVFVSQTQTQQRPRTLEGGMRMPDCSELESSNEITAAEELELRQFRREQPRATANENDPNSLVSPTRKQFI